MLPIRPYSLEYSLKWPSNIIIHSTKELNLTSDITYFDDQKFQTGFLGIRYYQKTSDFNLPYHFVIDKINNDYYPIVCRQLLSKCEFEDIDSFYYDSIHIGLMGNYDEEIAPIRLYIVLAHRVICPFLRLFRLGVNDVLLHKEISFNPESTCPGQWFYKSRLKIAIQTHLRKISVTRK